jgi:peroxiredoxin
LKRNILLLAVAVIAIAAMLIAARRLARPAYSRSALPASDVNGSPAPDFELTSLDGRQVKLSDYRGKAVLLNFWATWCSPCKVEMPWFIDLQKQYGPKGLQVLGIAMDDSGTAEIDKFAKTMGVDYPVLLGKEAVGQAYGGVQYLPTTFYIDRQGRIVDRVFGLISESEIKQDIEKALNNAAPAPPTRASVTQPSQAPAAQNSK